MIGSAEHLTLPADTFDLLDEVDDPVESIELIAADYIATFQTDRQSTCPNLEFKTLAECPSQWRRPPDFDTASKSSTAIRVVEKNLIYGVRMDETIDLYSFAAIADGACLSNEGELTDPAILDTLLPGSTRSWPSSNLARFAP